MDPVKFSVLLSLIVPRVIQQIVKDFPWDEKRATLEFYRSRVYRALSDEPLKVWHYSDRMLAQMFNDEYVVGSFNFPEEAC